MPGTPDRFESLHTSGFALGDLVMRSCVPRGIAIFCLGSALMLSGCGGSGSSSSGTSSQPPASPAASSNPTPTIASVTQPSVVAGSSSQPVTISGTGFVASSVVNLNGTALTTTYVSSTSVTAVVPASAIAADGTIKITVIRVASVRPLEDFFVAVRQGCRFAQASKV